MFSGILYKWSHYDIYFFFLSWLLLFNMMIWGFISVVGHINILLPFIAT